MPRSANKFLPLARSVVFGAVSLLSFMTFIMSAHILSWTNKWYSGYFDFAALAVALSVLSVVTFPTMLYLGKVRTGALPSFIAVELCWTCLLWILWLASAGTTASTNITGGQCGGGLNGWSTVCGETNAIEAFAFLNWLMLIAYFIVLLASSVVALRAGNSQIWTSAVNNANFEGGSALADTHEKTSV